MQMLLSAVQSTPNQAPRTRFVAENRVGPYSLPDVKAVAWGHWLLHADLGATEIGGQKDDEISVQSSQGTS